MPDRTELLRSLLALDGPLPEVVAPLRAFPWDSDEDLVTLKPEHVADLLGRYLSGELTPGDVEAWANAVESREDIALDPDHRESLNDALFTLANPTLAQPLSTGLARELIGQLTPITPGST
jgi:hypothetical protein